LGFETNSTTEFYWKAREQGGGREHPLVKNQEGLLKGEEKQKVVRRLEHLLRAAQNEDTLLRRGEITVTQKKKDTKGHFYFMLRPNGQTRGGGEKHDWAQPPGDRRGWISL